ncbi:MAG: hypothetical protein HYV25_02015 [Candidatus Harrisonbacteria bacterium]|nr:hypothetical protein [Candidatus Harrisonbacteria bacterium]
MKLVTDFFKSGILVLLLIGFVLQPLGKAVAESLARFDAWISGIPYLHAVVANAYLHWPAVIFILALITLILGAIWRGFGIALILWWLRGCREVKIYHMPGDKRRGKCYLVLGTHVLPDGAVMLRCFMFLHFWPPNGILEEVTEESEGRVWDYTGSTAWDHVRKVLRYGFGEERDGKAQP